VTGPFADSDHDRFSAWLRERAEPSFTDAVEHRFVEELGAGTLPVGAFRRYLVQDYAFIAPLTRLTGHALGGAPTAEARRALTGALDTLTGDEDDYFERAFDDLGVPTTDRTDPDVRPATAAFEDLLLRAAHEGDYEESVAVLGAAEWVYLGWAERAAAAGGAERWYLSEWVDVHRGPEFEGYVEFLRGELDRYGPDLSPRRTERVARLFRRAADLEVAFFDQAYGSEGPERGPSEVA